MARQLGTCGGCLSHCTVYINGLGVRPSLPRQPGGDWGTHPTVLGVWDLLHAGLGLTPGLRGNFTAMGCTELVMGDNKGGWKALAMCGWSMAPASAVVPKQSGLTRRLGLL